MKTIFKSLLASIIVLAPFSLSAAHAQTGDRTFSSAGNFLAGRLALNLLDTQSASEFLVPAGAQNWDNQVILQRSFGALAANGDFDAATKVAQQVLDLDPSYSIARLLLGTQALKERRYSSASKELSQVSLGDFVGITAAVLQSWALLGQDDLLGGLAVIDDLGELGLSDFLLYHRALMLDVAGQENALKQMGEAYKRDPFVANINEALIRMLANRGLFEEARSILDAYVAQGLFAPNVLQLRDDIEAERAPGKFVANAVEGASEIYNSLGIALARDGAPDVAVVFLQSALHLNPGRDHPRIQIAQLLEDLDRFAEANELYQKVDSSSYYFPLATVQLAENLEVLGNREEAILRLRELVERDAFDLDARSALADKLRFDEQYQESIFHYSAIIEQVGGNRPRDWIYFYLRGIAHEQLQQWEEAQQDMRRALELNPDQPQVLNYLGYSYVDRGENLKEALSMIERAVAASPQDGYIVDSLGWAFYQLGQFDLAVQYLEQAARLSPNDPEINDHLGDAYWQVGRQREAKFQWQIALDGQPNEKIELDATQKLAQGLIEDGETTGS